VFNLSVVNKGQFFGENKEGGKKGEMKNKRVFLILFLLAAINSFLIVNNSQAMTVTCPEGVLSNNNGTDSCTASGCSGTVSWSVTGIDASTNSNGGLTAGPASCGAITVTARCSDGTSATKVVRVTDAGQWVSHGESCGDVGPYLCHTERTIDGKKETVRWCVWDYPTCNNCTEYYPHCTAGQGCDATKPHYSTDYLDCGSVPPNPPPCCATGWKIEYWECAPCTNGQTISCYTGRGGTAGVGVCSAGTQTCTNEQWGTCAGEVLPSTEICGDDIDSDCDGDNDKNCEKPQGNTGNPGGEPCP